MIELTKEQRKEIVRIYGEDFEELDIPALWVKAKEENDRRIALRQEELSQERDEEIRAEHN